jgi:hypothetical protein
MRGRGIEEGEKERDFIRDFWEIDNSHLECGWEEWKNKYVLCVVLMEDG